MTIGSLASLALCAASVIYSLLQIVRGLAEMIDTVGLEMGLTPTPKEETSNAS